MIIFMNNQTKKLLIQNFGEKGTDHWIDTFHAKPKNYKRNTYYRIDGAGNGYAGVGNGLYLGRDENAIKSFYDCENEGLPVLTYMGSPKWLNLFNYYKFKKFKNDLLSKGISIINSDQIAIIVRDMGFDGIRYYDPFATGEEFVLFNTSTVKKI